MQKLLLEEAGRVTSVLNDVHAGVGLLSRVPTGPRDATALAEELGRRGLVGVGEAVEGVAQLEHQYRDAIRHAGRHGHISDDNEIDDEPMKEHYRLVLKLLRADMHAQRALPPAAEDGRVAHFLRDFAAFTEIGGKRLMTSRTQLRDTAIEMHNKQARIDNAERELALLREELRKQRAARAKAAAELEASLAKARDDLVAVQKAAEEELRSIQSNGVAKLGRIGEEHGKAGDGLHAALEKLQADLKAQTEAHADAEAGVRKRKVRARMEAENAVREYDAALGAMQAAVDAARAGMAAEAKPLADLVAYYQRVDVELSRLAREKAAEDERFWKEVTLANFEKKVRAKKIQRCYRAWKAKKAAREKAAKKAAGAKGK